MNLRGVADPAHPERDVVDLLFFPTGGGKTEAYPGLAAFTLALRRLRRPDDAGRGLSVLMRYTLRLLTLDQLGRAAAMICALELEREQAPERLGEWPFEIGLWVGRAATPNRMGRKGDKGKAGDKSAHVRTLRYARDSSREPPLPLEQCPWCGARFGRQSFRLHPNSNELTDLLVHCADRRCDFFRERPLPIVAVDEPIYRRLPAFLIGPDKDGEIDLDVERAALAETISWLPAVENRGEGVFVSFDADRVARWLERPGVRERGRRLENGWRTWADERGRSGGGFAGLPYVMLHSLAHMLMTSIALDCGYPASSLRERVYAGDDRYGILIYTGSSDSEGTLGGLVETGRRFADHLRRALRDNLLCSNDPVCAEHDPATPYAGRPLHGAACHGCLLIAETSCEQLDDFLDRALVAPTVSTADAAFFDVGGLDP